MKMIANNLIYDSEKAEEISRSSHIQRDTENLNILHEHVCKVMRTKKRNYFKLHLCDGQEHCIEPLSQEDALYWIKLDNIDLAIREFAKDLSEA